MDKTYGDYDGCRNYRGNWFPDEGTVVTVDMGSPQVPCLSDNLLENEKKKKSQE